MNPAVFASDFKKAIRAIGTAGLIAGLGRPEFTGPFSATQPSAGRPLRPTRRLF